MMRNRQAGKAFIFVTLFLDIMGAGIVFPILPELITSFTQGDVSVASRYYGYFVATFAAMQFLFSPVLGALSDQYGRRPVLLISLFGAGLDYLLMSIAPTLALLFLGRIVAGITAASYTVASAYMADVSPPEKRAQDFGLIGAAFGLGFILGPVLGGLLGSFGPRVPFVVAGVLTLVNWLYGYFVLPESLTPENRRPFAWRQANPAAAFGALRRYPGVLGLTTVIVCWNLAMQALVSTWVLYNSYRFSWSTQQQGLSLALFGAMAALVQAGLLRFLIAWWGERRVLVVGLINSVVGLALYGTAMQGWMMYAIIVVTALGAATQPAGQGLIANQVRADEQGAVQGALVSLFSAVGVISPLIATTLFSYFTAPERAVKVPGAPFFFGAVLTFLSLLLALYMFGRTTTQQRPAVVGGQDAPGSERSPAA